MCNGGPQFAFTRRQMRPMLRYKVIEDPVGPPSRKWLKFRVV
jgi:hypothetical protein